MIPHSSRAALLRLRFDREQRRESGEREAAGTGWLLFRFLAAVPCEPDELAAPLAVTPARPTGLFAPMRPGRRAARVLRTPRSGPTPGARGRAPGIRKLRRGAAEIGDPP